jgi:nucleoid-associated protein YgaU
VGVTATDLYSLANYLNPNPVDTPTAPATPGGTVAYGQQYWTALIEGLQDGIGNLDTKAVQPLNAAWQGLAAELATSKIQKTGQDLVSSVSQLSQVRSLLDSFWKQMSSYADQLNKNLTGGGGVSFFPLYFSITDASGGPVIYAGGLSAQQVAAESLSYYSSGGMVTPSFPQPEANAVNSAFAAAAKFVDSSGTLFNPAKPGEAQAFSNLVAAVENYRQAAADYLNELVADANNLDNRVSDQLLDLLPDVPYVPPAGSVGQEYVTVRSGESLWDIAQKVYGDGNKWTLIASNPVNSWITDPDEIPAGRQVWVPPIPKKVSAQAAG